MATPTVLRSLTMDLTESAPGVHSPHSWPLESSRAHLVCMMCVCTSPVLSPLALGLEPAP